ncbi:hypothetical protein MVES_003445 [Malassezia vespertilionis]|uniref:Metallo-beta-lactamase domain-containing protein n=1 Tax=Malassezia vespertilionis TaxID=2020962 RepID=A0A2N1J7Z9_9BASI|nr:hypothetical protein MVES_003445 [Malassezia vespertilionis]
MSDLAAQKRQLSIKTGVVKRLSKEVHMYTDECKEQEAAVKKAIDEAQEPWEVRRQEGLLKDSAQMIPDTKRRLQDAVADISTFIEGLTEDSKGTEEFKSALQAIENAQQPLLVKIDRQAVMVDCGEGTQRQLINPVVQAETKLSQIRTILITHLHPDHILGVVPLMFSIMGPSAPSPRLEDGLRLTIYGPLGLRAYIRTTLSVCYASLSSHFVVHELLWPSQPAYAHEIPADAAPTFTYTEHDPALPSHLQGQTRILPWMPPHGNELEGLNIRMDPETCAWEAFAQIPNTGFFLSAAPITHRCPTLGYVFTEAPCASVSISPRDLALLDSNTEALYAQQGIQRPRTLIPKLVQERIPLHLPDGNTLHPPPIDRPGRKICVLGDTSDGTAGLTSFGPDGLPNDELRGLLRLAQDADLVVHECTYAYMSETDLAHVRTESEQLAHGLQTMLLKPDEAEPRAKERGHSVPRIAGAFAAYIGAHNLALNHFSARIPAPNVVGTAPLVSAAQLRDDAQHAESIKRFHVMREIERQATNWWNTTLESLQSESPAHNASLRRAMAAYDGLCIPIAPRPVDSHV